MFAIDLDKSEVLLYDEIGPSYWGLIDASMVIDALAKIGESKDVTIRLNSPGGSVDEGIAIYNAIKRHKGAVTTVVDSLAASMASYILQAGSRRIVVDNSMVMVHNPWTIAWGDAAELRKSADVLDKYAQRMIPDYAQRSGKTDEEILAIMGEETWYAGSEAVEAGFADEVMQGRDIDPRLGTMARTFRNVPKAFFERREVAKRDIDVTNRFPARKAVQQAAAKLPNIMGSLWKK